MGLLDTISSALAGNAVEIFLYSNDQSTKIQMPVIPDSIEVSSPQDVENFDTIDLGSVRLIGKVKTKSISLETFFPANFYPFVRGWSSLSGMDYVDQIQEWRMDRKPIYVYIGALNISGRFVIPDLSYSIKDGSGDIYYKMKLEEYVAARTPPITNGAIIKTMGASSISVAKDGYTKMTSIIAGNMRGGAGLGYGLAKGIPSIGNMRKLRQVGNYIQTNKGFILKKYIEVRKNGI